MENAATAMISNVAWYGCGTKVGWLRMMRASISCAVKKQTPAMPLNCIYVSTHMDYNIVELHRRLPNPTRKAMSKLATLTLLLQDCNHTQPVI